MKARSDKEILGTFTCAFRRPFGIAANLSARVWPRRAERLEEEGMEGGGRVPHCCWAQEAVAEVQAAAQVRRSSAIASVMVPAQKNVVLLTTNVSHSRKTSPPDST